MSRFSPPLTLSALIFLLGVCACEPLKTTPVGTSTASAPKPPATRAPLPPAPTLPPAPDFVEGLSEIPEGKHLFVEYWQASDGESSSGTCPNAAMIDFPTYSYNSGVLDTSGLDLGRGIRNLAPPPMGFFGYGESRHGAMGGGVSSQLHTIEALPYVTPPYEQAVIHSVDAQGAIVAEIQGNTYLIEPGRSWIRRVENDPTPECHTITTYRLINYGLLDNDPVETHTYDLLRVVPRTGLLWSADGEQLIVAEGTRIAFYSTSPLTPTTHWPTSVEASNMAMSPDGQMLAFSDSDGAIWLVDMPSGAYIGEPMSRPPGPWRSLAFSQDSKTLASGSVDGIVQLWDVESGQPTGAPWVDQMRSVSRLSFGADRTLLTNDLHQIRIWNIQTGEVIRRIKVASVGDTCSYDAARTPDGTVVASGGCTMRNGEAIQLWDAATGESSGALIGEPWDVRSLTFNADGTWIAAGSTHSGIQVWDVRTGESKGKWALKDANWFDEIVHVAFSPDETRLAALIKRGAFAWVVCLLDLDTFQAQRFCWATSEGYYEALCK
jgi:hypothetical protein